MAETSRSQVTITLGRSGQVVKRGGPALDSNSFDSCAAAGSKRSVRDRLGSDVDQVNSKRQRGNIAANVGDARDMQLGKGDLRFKLMQKNVQKGVRVDGLHNGLDLRDRLSRAVRPSMTTSGIRQRMPEPNDTRQRVPELKDAPILGRIPSVRSADALPQLDSLRNAYSPWTLDQLRRGSPDRSLRTSRGFSPQRNEEDLPKRRVMRTYDDVRTIPYMSKDILEPSRSMGSAPFLTKSTVPDGSVKSVPALRAPPLPSSSIAPKTSYMV